MLFASFTITDGAVPTAVATVALCASPAFLAMEEAELAVAVAVNVSGLPVSPATVAVSVLVPAVAPRVHDVTAAIPELLLVAVVPAGGHKAIPPAPDGEGHRHSGNVISVDVTHQDCGRHSYFAVPTVAVCVLPALRAILQSPRPPSRWP